MPRKAQPSKFHNRDPEMTDLPWFRFYRDNCRLVARMTTDEKAALMTGICQKLLGHDELIPDFNDFEPDVLEVFCDFERAICDSFDEYFSKVTAGRDHRKTE